MTISAINAEVFKEGLDGYDADVKVGKIMPYVCVPALALDATVTELGKENALGITMTIAQVDDDSAGSSAIMMKSAIAASALGLIAYM